MSNELNQYSCHRIYMINFQNDMTIFVLHDTMPGVYGFNTRGVRKWIIDEKGLILIQEYQVKSWRQF
jgi:hypothetical protein